MRGYETGTIHRRKDESAYIEVWKQPFFWWLLAKLYHFWEERTCRLMNLLAKWHRSLVKEEQWYIPFDVRQELRCYELTHKKRVRLMATCITREQYDAINGDTPLVQPRREINKPISLEQAVETAE